jgi:hypothetical protein
MNKKIISLFWGLILILAGAFFLAREVGYFSAIPDGFWKYIFAGISLLFFTSWLATGVHNWGWLFPACISGGVAVTILLDELGNVGSAAGMPVLLGVALPFIAAFLVDVKKNRWALIPAWVMLVVSMITLISDRVDGNLIGAFVLYSIAFPFLVVYLLDRKQWWALIPAGVLAVIGIIPLLSSLFSGGLMAVAIMGLFAMAFLVVFFWSRANWWALIPAGTFISIGVMIWLITSEIVNDNQVSSVIFGGLGITFAVLWLMKSTFPTNWAKYPAVGLLMSAILAFFTGEQFRLFWPIVLIVVGLVIIAGYLFRKPRETKLIPQQPPLEE